MIAIPVMTRIEDTNDYECRIVMNQVTIHIIGNVSDTGEWSSQTSHIDSYKKVKIGLLGKRKIWETLMPHYTTGSTSMFMLGMIDEFLHQFSWHVLIDHEYSYVSTEQLKIIIEDMYRFDKIFVMM